MGVRATAYLDVRAFHQPPWKYIADSSADYLDLVAFSPRQSPSSDIVIDCVLSTVWFGYHDSLPEWFVACNRL